MTKSNQIHNRGSGETTGVLLEALGLALQSKQPVLVLDRMSYKQECVRHSVAELRRMVDRLELKDVYITVRSSIDGLRGMEVVSYTPITFDDLSLIFKFERGHYLIMIHSRYAHVPKS